MKDRRGTLIALSLIALILSGLWVTMAFISTQRANSGSGSYNTGGSSGAITSNLSNSLYGGISFDITKTHGYLDGYNLFKWIS
ncbi:MAG: hypothetical protein ACW974_11320 [Candidatus Thorarchaeota archaeon]|jgi:hypothetical protein